MPMKPFKFDNEIIKLLSCTSTNDVARFLSNQKEGIVVSSAIQVKGRGRRENFWISEPGGLYFSFILKPDFSPKKNEELSLLVVETVKDLVIYYFPKTSVVFKEPNDILLNGKKVSGILIEAAISEEKNNYIIVGIGINIFNIIPDTATNFYNEGLIETNMSEILNKFIIIFEKAYNDLIN
jgi:BirA family transcriptional regulator, biotin operon repressor / biotin---[acetyl-CoA-carboxylase] ligase